MRISTTGVVVVVAALLGVAVVDAATQWCIAKSNLADSYYQGALDWACGPLSGQGQVNCAPIQNGSSCYLPNNYQSHASWAMNAYYQAQGQASQACDFQGTGTVTTTNPGTTTCSYTAPNGTTAGGTSRAMGNHLTHDSRPLSYLSALVVFVITYLTAQAQ